MRSSQNQLSQAVKSVNSAESQWRETTNTEFTLKLKILTESTEFTGVSSGPQSGPDGFVVLLVQDLCGPDGLVVYGPDSSGPPGSWWFWSSVVLIVSVLYGPGGLVVWAE